MIDPAKRRTRSAPPRAGTMLASLRGLGYTTSTALADIIDNSISAKARRVALTFNWAGDESSVTILDDGEGMSPAQLDGAMRLGEKGPSDARISDDLGRFGLGLKTASFSQCRRLTVRSKRDGDDDCLRWDLDFLAASGNADWLMLEGCHPGSEHLHGVLDNVTDGTVVIWEVLDRIVGPGFTEQDFLDLIDDVEQHLAMTFHRFLTGPHARLLLTINDRPIAPWDPFLSSHVATWSSPVERILTADGRLEVQGHVLPHKDRIGAAEATQAAGPEGWTAQQGFYVYRGERLLVAGGWLGLGQGRAWTREEAHRLARIRLDLPNTSDHEWKIDIRKSTAHPPVAIRGRLVAIAEDVRRRARAVFAHRGRAATLTTGPIAQAWMAESFSGGTRYRIDESHPAVAAALVAAGAASPEVRAMLRVLEETIPIQRIWLDTAEQKETPRTAFAAQPPSAVTDVMSIVYTNFRSVLGLSAHEAKARLLRTEPFHNFLALVEALPDEQ